MVTTPTKLPRKQIPLPQQRLIWVASAGQCSFPGCPIRTVEPETDSDGAVTIGEVAHICAYEDDGPRANPSMSLADRNKYSNLLVLCPNHHTTVDKQWKSYPAEMLRKWKADTERMVTIALRNAMPQVTFLELERVTASLVTHDGLSSQDMSVIPPADKLRKNELSSITHDYLLIALARADVVRDFVNRLTRIDDSFSARLRGGFVDEYERLKKSGSLGDELFQQMLEFATSGKRDLRSHAAGLAILGYYFEACEVFEK